MKSLVIKSCLLLPLLWFAVYLVMIVFGCISKSAGCCESFYCGIYCKVGITLFTLATGAFAFYVVRCCVRKKELEK